MTDQKCNEILKKSEEKKTERRKNKKRRMNTARKASKWVFQEKEPWLLQKINFQS